MMHGRTWTNVSKSARSATTPGQIETAPLSHRDHYRNASSANTAYRLGGTGADLYADRRADVWRTDWRRMARRTRRLHVSLLLLFTFTFIGLFADDSRANAVSAQIDAPVANSALNQLAPTINFSGDDVSAYWLYAGSTPGGAQFFNSGNLGTATSVRVDNLPGTGATIYLRLWYRAATGPWYYVDQQNFAPNNVVQTPPPGSTLPGSEVTFHWPNAKAERFWLVAGTAAGGNQYASSGDLGAATNYTVLGLPTDGSTVHLRLWFKADGSNWQYADATYVAHGSPVTIESPPAGSRLAEANNFAWPSADATDYWLFLGRSAGARDIYDSGYIGGAKNLLVRNLPNDGATIYARLWYRFGTSTWQYSDTNYIATEGDFEISSLIVVDQFGYLPSGTKIAVLRDPVVGHDSALSYTPGGPISLVNVDTNQTVYSANAQAWNGGATDASSGDRAWWFDFSSVTTQGQYQVVDQVAGIASQPFRIDSDVYDDVLRDAVRTFFYQRSGFAKSAPYADPRWSDGASHIGSLQDGQARRYDAPGDASTERDLRGGWYDAGDYNKYTNWTAEYVISLLHSYIENPGIWTDDFDIPESGNGIPDLLDEIRWGVDWLVRMQNSDGSVLSIVGVDSATPPSAATGQSLYGTANTSATLNTAAAFAFASRVFADTGITSLVSYANELRDRAEDAWDWGVANPNVIFRNNDANRGTQGLGAGQQEVDAFRLSMIKLGAAIYLTDLTGAAEYNNFAIDNYQSARLFLWTYVDPYEQYPQRDVLYYASLADTSNTTRDHIRNTYSSAMNSPWNWGAVDAATDPYRAHLNVYGWGSNREKASKGMVFLQLALNGINNRSVQQNTDAASGYLHYLHGVNPQALVYLSNMADVGGEYSVDTFYHSWFFDGSPLWDSVAESLYGPAPGFLVGGPNPYYSWEGWWCDNGQNPDTCGDSVLSPPAGQPDQKSYNQFNDSWPLNSWEVTENSNGYQTAYIRLLAQFVGGN